MLFPPGRHPGPADPVLNDVEECSVAPSLDVFARQVGNPRVHVAADFRVTLAIPSVTRGAVILVVLDGLPPGVGLAAKWIHLLLGLDGNRQTYELAGDGPLQPSRLLIRRKSASRHEH